MVIELNQVRFISATCRHPSIIRGSSSIKKKKKEELEQLSDMQPMTFVTNGNLANSNFGMSKFHEAESQITPGTIKPFKRKGQPRPQCVSTGFFLCSLMQRFTALL